MIDNLVGNANWTVTEEKLQAEKLINKAQEIIMTDEKEIIFSYGDKVISIKHPEYGSGIIFKDLENGKHWVAFQDQKDRMTNLPCLMDVFGNKDLKYDSNYLNKIENSKN